MGRGWGEGANRERGRDRVRGGEEEGREERILAAPGGNETLMNLTAEAAPYFWYACCWKSCKNQIKINKNINKEININ